MKTLGWKLMALTVIFATSMFADDLVLSHNTLGIDGVETVSTSFSDALELDVDVPAPGGPVMVLATLSSKIGAGAREPGYWRLYSGTESSLDLASYQTGTYDKGLVSLVHIFPNFIEGVTTVSLQHRVGETDPLKTYGVNMIGIPLVTTGGSTLEYDLVRMTEDRSVLVEAEPMEVVAGEIELPLIADDNAMFVAVSLNAKMLGDEALTGIWQIEYKDSESEEWIALGKASRSLVDVSNQIDSGEDVQAVTIYASASGLASGTYEVRVVAETKYKEEFYLRSYDLSGIEDEIITFNVTLAVVALSYDDVRQGLFEPFMVMSDGGDYDMDCGDEDHVCDVFCEEDCEIGKPMATITGVEKELSITEELDLFVAMSFVGYTRDGSNQTSQYDLALTTDTDIYLNQENQRLSDDTQSAGSGASVGVFKSLEPNEYVVSGRHRSVTGPITTTSINLVGITNRNLYSKVVYDIADATKALWGDGTEEPKDVYARNGDTVVAPDSVDVWPGWTFMGWDFDNDGVPENLNGELVVDGDSMAVAIYERDPNSGYTVTFKLNGKGYWDGDTSDEADREELNVAHGTDALDPGIVTGFPGWSFTSWDGALGPITANTTITALYDRDLNSGYTVTFKLDGKGYWDGDTSDEADREELNVAHGTDALDPGIVTGFPGWSFISWDGGLGPITADTTITALYDRDLNSGYTVTFKLDGKGYWDGDTSDEADREELNVAHGTDASEPGTVTGFPGWTYIEWNGALGPITADLILTAQYQIDPNSGYTVTFSVLDKGYWDGNTSDVGNRLIPNVPHGMGVAAPGVVMGFPGWEFNGWDGNLGPITADVTFNALYISDADSGYTVTFVVDPLKGTSPDTLTFNIAHGTAFEGTIPSVQALPEWIFVGWDMDGDLSADDIVPALNVITSDLVFVALFNVDPEGRADPTLFNGWALISSPYVNWSPTMIEDENPGVTVLNAMYSYRGGAYTVHDKTENLEPGFGYWIYLTGVDPGGLELTVNGTPPETTNHAINTGWNLIGPFDAETEVASMQWVEGYPYYWDAEFQEYTQAMDLLELGRGYWGYITEVELFVEAAVADPVEFTINHVMKSISVDVRGLFDDLYVYIYDETNQTVVMQKQLVDSGTATDAVRIETIDMLVTGLRSNSVYLISITPVRQGTTGLPVNYRFYTGSAAVEVVEELDKELLEGVVLSAGADGGFTLVGYSLDVGQEIEWKGVVRRGTEVVAEQMEPVTEATTSSVGFGTPLEDGDVVFVVIRVLENGDPITLWRTLSATVNIID